MPKTKLTLSIEDTKVKEFKKLAIDADMTLSDYLVTAGTITPFDKIKKQNQLDISNAAGAANINK